MTPTQIVIREEILRRLEAGESLREICRDDGFPTEGAVRKWARDEDDFGTRYMRARQLGYMRLAEDILEIADTQHEGEIVTTKREQLISFGVPVQGTEVEKTERRVADMIEHRRIQIDTRKWMLAKMLPKVYGEKKAVELSGPDGAPLQTETVVVPAHDPIAASQTYQQFMDPK